MAVHVGVSGWSYSRWRGDFYPAGLPHRRELEHVAGRLGAVEVNATFYRLQRPETFAQWLAQTPDGFRFSLKGPRFLTHLKGLHEPRAPLANFFASGPLLLGHRLGPVLWQLPARTTFQATLLEDFLRLLPGDTSAAATLAAGHDDRVEGRTWLGPVEHVELHHVLEPRHASFGSPEAIALLRAYDVGLVVADSAGTFPAFDAVTSAVVDVRLHGPERLYCGGYSDEELDRWADRVRGWCAGGADVWVFFDNDADGRAPYDAMALQDRLVDGATSP